MLSSQNSQALVKKGIAMVIPGLGFVFGISLVRLVI
jgi:hypothetical protein